MNPYRLKPKRFIATAWGVFLFFFLWYNYYYASLQNKNKKTARHSLVAGIKKRPSTSLGFMNPGQKPFSNIAYHI